MLRFRSPMGMVRRVRPEDPVTCARPAAARRAARWFANHFPGRVFFAVKTNPAPWALEAIWAGGVRQFDVASLVEVQTVARVLPEARMAFMHPVKSELAIRRAYHEYGVRDFAFDCDAELDKILRATAAANGDEARDLGLFLRVAVENSHSQMKLHAKFGASPEDAIGLLQRARAIAVKLGTTFHVGSQTMDPVAYVQAMDRVASIIRKAGVIVDVLDVGGGFPAAYPGMVPPPLARFVEAIEERFETMPVAENCELWCEPGRAIVADSASVVVRVDLRKGNALYINDGTYGGLFDAGTPGWLYPMRLLRRDPFVGPLAEFSLFGPTCDSIDTMHGPFVLPDAVREGDYLEIGMLGAYSASLRTDFNGFGGHQTVVMAEPGPRVADLFEPSRPVPERAFAQAVAVESVARGDARPVRLRRLAGRRRERRAALVYRHRDPST